MIPYLQREDKAHLLSRPRKPILMLVGDGACVFDDIEEFWSYGLDHDVGCINNIAKAFPCDFEHFFAGDSHDRDMREVCVSLNNTEVLSHCYNPMSETFAIRWFKENAGWFGTTAMFAMIAGLRLGYLRIVLAGIPMNACGRWYESDFERGNYDHGVHLWRWKQFRWRPWASFVRSMSGLTAEILKKPTFEWLTEPKHILNSKQAGQWLAKPIRTIKSLPGG